MVGARDDELFNDEKCGQAAAHAVGSAVLEYLQVSELVKVANLNLNTQMKF